MKTKSQLLVHESTFSELDFIADQQDDALGILVKDDVLIISTGQSQNTTTNQQQPRKLSIRKDVAQLYGIVPRQLADIISINMQDYICSFVEISFRYQFLIVINISVVVICGC